MPATPDYEEVGIVIVEPQPVEHDLDDRYGRTRRNPRRRRRLIAAAALAALIVFAAWLTWSGIGGQATPLDATTVGHEIHGEHAVTVEYHVTVDPGSRVSCALQALNEEHSIVGWKVVSLPASDDRARSFSDTLRTTQPATTGLIYRCWLT